MPTNVLTSNGMSSVVLSAMVAALLGWRGSQAAELSTGDGGGKPIAVARGESRAVLPHFIGFNGNMTRDHMPWDEPRLVDALARSHAGNFRYPGGTVGNYWDWDLGGINRSLSKKDFGATSHVFAMRRLKSRYPLENFAKGMKAGGVTPVFMLNMTFHTLEEQLGHLKKAEKSGVPVKYVELGNEFYFGRGAHPAIDDVYPSVEKYAETASKWAAAIKAAFPDVRLAACAAGHIGNATKSKRRRTWDARLLKVLRGVDALTIHCYTTPGLTEADPADKKKGPSIERREKQLAALKTSEGVSRMLGRPYSLWQYRVEAGVIPRDMELWITEFNIADRVGAARGTWAHGLAIVNFLHVFLADGRPNLACYHNFYTQPLYTAVHRRPQGRSRNKDGDEGNRPTPFSFNGAGEAIALFGEAMRSATRATRLTFAPTPTAEESEGRPSYPTLIGWIFEGGPGSKALIANLSYSTVEVAGRALGLRGSPYRQVYSEPATPVLNEQSLKRSTGRLSGPLAVPAYSITVIESQ